jgi:drug/metabolite transporter (DMT)-like permease
MAGSMVALLATTLEFLACGFFKVAAKRMEPLRGTRPIRVLSLAVRSPYWLVGMLLILAGIVLQFLSLTFIPLSSANPLYLTPLLVLLVMAVGYFHERLTRREWLSLGLLAIATLVIAVSVAHGEHAGKALPSYALFFAVVIPCVVIPLIVFSVGDLRQTGRHARPIAGIAYGASIGVLIGTGQFAAVGLFNAYQSGLRGTALLQEPYLWAMVLSAGFGLGQILIALQRCRMAIVITVNSVVGQTQLVVMATLLYGEGWPHDRVWSLVRAGGFALGLAAILIFPRHEPDPEESGAHETQPGPGRQASAARGPYA